MIVRCELQVVCRVLSAECRVSCHMEITQIPTQIQEARVDAHTCIRGITQEENVLLSLFHFFIFSFFFIFFSSKNKQTIEYGHTQQNENENEILHVHVQTT